MSDRQSHNEIVFECGGCMAFMAHPDNPDVGECRRHAPVPLVVHWPERPELNEHGRVKGFRLTVWPGVNATDSCCEYAPSDVTLAKVAKMQAATESLVVADAGRLN